MAFGLGHAGSTSLSQLLQVHPDISWNVAWHQNSLSHEVRYWQRRRDRPRSRDGWAHYFDIVPPGSRLRLGGKTPSVWHEGAEVAKKMLAIAPWLKVLMFSREPIEWTTSSLYMSEKDVQQWAKLYTKTLQSDPFAHASARDAKACLAKMYVPSTFRAFLDAFPRHQVFLAASEELAVDRKAVLHRLEDFLGIRHIDWDEIFPQGKTMHTIKSTPDMRPDERCLADLCGRGVAQAWEDLFQNYTGKGVMYLPENRWYWKERGALRHTPLVNKGVCEQVFNDLHLPPMHEWPFVPEA